MEKQNDMFPELKGEELIQALRDNAYKTEETIVTRDYSFEALQEFKEKLADNSVAMAEFKAKLKEIEKEYKAKMAPHEQAIGEAVSALRKKYSEDTEEVFLFDDQAEGMMHIVDQFGKHIHSRRLLPSEKQLKFVAGSKSGTHDH